jgi:putative hydrolase of the HAD superfamily
MSILLIDADDTLWENNIYFERALTDFISFLEHKEMTPAEVRNVINEVERENIKLHGYGLKSFTRALIAAFERLSVEPITEAVHTVITGFAQQIAEHSIELISGVAETLDYLSLRHSLYVVTKGDGAEQRRKVELSGIDHYFRAVEVLPEKNEETYRTILDLNNFNPRETWMIGNSPKSDINPSLAAGLNAVFIPHDNTWVLEHEDLASPPTPQQTLLKLARFSDLRQHF